MLCSARPFGLSTPSFPVGVYLRLARTRYSNNLDPFRGASTHRLRGALPHHLYGIPSPPSDPSSGAAGVCRKTSDTPKPAETQINYKKPQIPAVACNDLLGSFRVNGTRITQITRIVTDLILAHGFGANGLSPISCVSTFADSPIRRFASSPHPNVPSSGAVGVCRKPSDNQNPLETLKLLKNQSSPPSPR